MSKVVIKIEDIEECANQALFFLQQQRVQGENLIYKNATKQFVDNIKRLAKDGRDSIQPTSTDKTT